MNPIPQTVLDLQFRTLHLPSTPFPQLLAIFLILLTASEANSLWLASTIFKTLSSLTFLAGGIALAYEGPTTELDPIILGLAMSVIGDVLLIPSRSQFYDSDTIAGGRVVVKCHCRRDVVEGPGSRFKFGMAFFALAHGAYIVSSLSSLKSSLNSGAALASLRLQDFILTIAMVLGLTYYLGLVGNRNRNRWVQIPGDMRLLVDWYVAIIAVMVAVAVAAGQGWQRRLAAGAFAGSDIFVAVDVFWVRRMPGKGYGRVGWRWRAVGWWLYFAAQMALAGCVGKGRE